MKFGIFYEHQLPRPWGPKSEYQLLQDSLTQIELADKLGYDYAWEVEHHFLEEYSHSSAPEVFLGGSATASSSSRPTSPIASPRKSPRSISCPAEGSISAWAKPQVRPSCIPSA